MFSLNNQYHYYFCPAPVDMRKGIDSLCAYVRFEIKMDPISCNVFVFISKNRYTVKILQWQNDGFTLYQKRIEKGTFELPKYDTDSSTYQLEWKKFVMMMEGITMKNAVIRKRFYYDSRCVK